MEMTGNRAVDAMIDYSPPSHSIPHMWFKTIVNEKGKPNNNAILILAEIVYWYRPSVMKDEETGEFLGYKKRFKGDWLQKSRKGFEQTLHLSKDQTYRAIKFLEELGVIKTHLRHVETDSMTLNNVRFIELVPEKLKELTYPIAQKRDPIAQKRDPYRVETRPLSRIRETNTEITNTEITNTEITTRETSNSRLETVVDHYQNQYGNIPATVLTAMDKFLKEGFEAEVIMKAIDLAVDKAKRWDYVAGVLRKLEDEHNVKTLEAYEHLVQKKKQRNGNAPNHQKVPDWLEKDEQEQRIYEKRKSEELMSDVPTDEELMRQLQALREAK